MKAHIDLLIKDARIIDGTGNPYYLGDIAIVKGQITRIDRTIGPDSAKMVINAAGLTVCPGFFDTHSHDDVSLLINPCCHDKILQGVTTDVIGNCGASMAPISEDHRDDLKTVLTVIGGDHLAESFWQINSLNEYLERLESAKPGINVLTLVGHTTSRIAVMGMEKRSPVKSELQEMKRLVRQAMKDGAFGLSTGLIYAPASYAQTDEIIELAKITGLYNGIYTSHIRSESDWVIEAVEETIEIARQAGVRVHFSHHKVAGKNNWGRSHKTLKMFAEARESGVEVTCDQYPYIAASTYLAAALPPYIQAGGPEIYTEKLKIPEIRKEVIDVIEKGGDDQWENMIKGAGFEGIVISTSKKHPDYLGKSIAEIANIRGKNPYDLFLDLVIEEKLGISVIFFNMNETDVRNIMEGPMTMIGTDGLPDFGAGMAHPRLKGTFPRILGHYVREQRVIGMEEAIRKMTSLPAQTFGVKGKGLLREGFDADIVIFNPEKIVDKSTFENPLQDPEGIDWVIVNGEVAVENGKVTGATSGKVLRHKARFT